MGAPDPCGIDSAVPDAGKPLIFISYRRIDSRRHVAALTERLALSFGPDAIFVDTDKIRAGSNWVQALVSALERATVLLVAIGDKWFSATDEFSRRRIDGEDDWVSKEIQHALASGKPIIPIRFDGQAALQPEALPRPIVALAERQSIEIRDSDWASDYGRLLDRLTEYGFERQGPPIAYPPPVVLEPVASQAEIDAFIHRNPGWRIQYRPHPTSPGVQRRGIGTTLIFRSFRDAMHFMFTASWGIDERHHHPEWENVWKSVVIWITQFDIGGDITNRNLELAEYLVSVYEPYSKVV